MNNHYIRVSILFILVLIETLSCTFWMDTMAVSICRWSYLISGLSIGLYLLLKPGKADSGFPNLFNGLSYLMFIILLTWLVPSFYTLYHTHPLDFAQADMLPVIQVMCRRWLHYEPVYAVIPEFWYGTMPVYLPAMWIPFIPSVALSFDPRWITLAIVCVALGAILFRKSTNPMSWLYFLFLGLWFDYLIHNRDETFRLSEEGVVYGYLIGLTLCLYSGNAIGIGVLTALCLLSRYGIVFYSVGLFYCLWKKNGSGYGKKLLWSMLLSVAGLMTLGGAWSNSSNFIRLPGQYLSSIDTYTSKYQAVLQESLGMVPFFDIPFMPWVIKILTFVLIVGSVVMVWFYKKVTHRFYLLAFLKLTLVVFYNLLIIPYQYLMYTSVLVSMVMYYLYSNHQEPQSLNLAA